MTDDDDFDLDDDDKLENSKTNTDEASSSEDPFKTPKKTDRSTAQGTVKKSNPWRDVAAPSVTAFVFGWWRDGVVREDAYVTLSQRVVDVDKLEAERPIDITSKTTTSLTNKRGTKPNSSDAPITHQGIEGMPSQRVNLKGTSQQQESTITTHRITKETQFCVRREKYARARTENGGNLDIGKLQPIDVQAIAGCIQESHAIQGVDMLGMARTYNYSNNATTFAMTTLAAALAVRYLVKPMLQNIQRGQERE